MRIVKAAYTTLRLYILRRRQIDSRQLREYFRRRHDIDVGLYSYGCFDRWRMPGPMTVGRYCSIAKTARSVRNNHPLEALTTHPALYEAQFGVIEEDRAWDNRLVIEDDVWIGHNVVILPGCRRIGRGAVIGAGSIVTHDVERYRVMAGKSGPRVLRERFEPVLAAAIEASRWWEMSLSELGEMVRREPGVAFAPTAHGLRAWARQDARRAEAALSA